MAKKSKPKPNHSPSQPASSKQEQVLAMLRRQQGVSIAEICEVTGWQPQSVRGFMSGALKKRLKIAVVSERGDEGERRYYVAPLTSTER